MCLHLWGYAGRDFPSCRQCVLSSHFFGGRRAPGVSRSHLDLAVELSCSDRNSLCQSAHCFLAIAQWFVTLSALLDVNTEFEQLAMEAGCTPTEVLPAHLVDQISGLTQKDGSSAVAAPYLPGPEQTKAGTMPGYHRYWLDDGQH